MDALEKLNQQIDREIACIDDLTEEIRMLTRKGQINIAKQLERDLHNSLEQLKKLHESKRFWATVEGLNQQGKLYKAVNELANQA
ncbi:hypothetical protein [Lysinibacillus sp. NPDC047702]|uniref:hypothetical protein n=1 Tax=unclassified Lysinibacillus TaxID=2636778 RepID=UPI003D01FC91